ncbi:MAG: hypothetical protein LUJ09_01265 [Firmicutes bacterium]|nr:hypothetical protein [Bacillota bacterium]
MGSRSEASQPLSMQEAMRLAQSEDGQKLLNMLQQNHGDTLQSAMTQAQAGNYEGVKQALTSLLQSREAQALMQQLRGQAHG